MSRSFLSVIAASTLLLAPKVFADSSSADMTLGVRTAIAAGRGTPANDVVSAGIVLRYTLSPQWSLGFEWSNDTFDFEGPAAIVSIQQDHSVATIDATVDQTNIFVWAERRYGDDNAGQWFWLLGVGQGSPDVSDAEGAIDGGGNFYLETDASSETILLAGLGYRGRWGANWLWHTTLRAEHRMTDYEVHDIPSGATGSVGSWTLLGLELGLSYRF